MAVLATKIKTANGIIEDPVAVYERGCCNQRIIIQTNEFRTDGRAATKSDGTLSGYWRVSFYGYIAGAAAIVIVGGGLYKSRGSIAQKSAAGIEPATNRL